MTPMAFRDMSLSLVLFVSVLLPYRVLGQGVSTQSAVMEPFNCSKQITNCNSLLYHMDNGLTQQQVASFYSVDATQLRSIYRSGREDYLITVPCSCNSVNGTTAYFYNTRYKVQKGDTFVTVSAQIYSGVAWRVGNEQEQFIAGDVVTIHLLCGCDESGSQVVVTYSVEPSDTIAEIASLLSSTTQDIESMNKDVLHGNSFIDIGWVLYVRTQPDGAQSPDTGGSRKKDSSKIIIGVVVSVTLLVAIGVATIFARRRQLRLNKTTLEDPKSASKAVSKASSVYTGNLVDRGFEPERPHVYSLQEIEDAANNFDQSRKIGEGGYGSVYFGMLGGKEVAIKKMRSNKSKEFFAELKSLGKIHHINVVELFGYAYGDEFLYLVYEYVRNGSLNDHLHDPAVKGHQPLSWMARTQIALDAAKGIEYIHDHTKAKYVHRDIKTSNILLDDGLRAKVSDFGLAKLVERTNDEELIATRLVGTPGYLAPESVKELQVTTKTDVFAFGVVLGELITGQRALIRDTREPSKMKSLISVICNIFKAEDPHAALDQVIDVNLQGSYPIDEIYKLAEIGDWCLSEDPVKRPEMRDVVMKLSQIMMSSVDWEASLGGRSQVFSGDFKGR